MKAYDKTLLVIKFAVMVRNQPKGRCWSPEVLPVNNAAHWLAGLNRVLIIAHEDGFCKETGNYALE